MGMTDGRRRAPWFPGGVTLCYSMPLQRQGQPKMDSPQCCWNRPSPEHLVTSAAMSLAIIKSPRVPKIDLQLQKWLTPTSSRCKGRKQVPKADCNLAFICIFKLVRLWTVAKQWQRIFIIISLVGWGKGGREWLRLIISLEGKTPFSISDHHI